LTVAGQYTDANATGGSTEGRDGLESAIKHACKIRGILAVYDLDRLSRKALDALRIAERLQKRHVDLMLLIEQIDTTTPMGRLMFGIKANMGQYVRETTAARTSVAMRHHQAVGRRMGRKDRLPFGTRCSEGDSSVLVPDDSEQATIARMKTLNSDGLTYRAICRILDAEGLTRRGKSWMGCGTLVKTILDRENERRL
jgi:DNA invertase Pin-like site-specific DNA recombinase